MTKIFLIRKVNTLTWTKEEDDIIFEFSKNKNKNKWKILSDFIKNKSPTQCYLRSKILDPILKKGRFSKEEDELLLNLVKQYGFSWAFISKFFKTRTPKQIRLRYSLHLNEKICKNKFSDNEDFLLMKLFDKFGNNWTLYRPYLSNRTSVKIKNRYYSNLKKNIKSKQNKCQIKYGFIEFSKENQEIIRIKDFEISPSCNIESKIIYNPLSNSNNHNFKNINDEPVHLLKDDINKELRNISEYLSSTLSLKNDDSIDEEDEISGFFNFV